MASSAIGLDCGRPADLIALVKARMAREGQGLRAAANAPLDSGERLLGDNVVRANVVFKDTLCQDIREKLGLVPGKAAHNVSRQPVIRFLQHPATLTKQQLTRAEGQAREWLCSAAVEVWQERNPGLTMKGHMSNNQMVQCLPELLPASSKLKKFIIGGDGSLSPFDDVPDMVGQLSVRVDPATPAEAAVQPGDALLFFEGEMFYENEYPALHRAHLLGGWDDSSRPDLTDTEKVYELERYAHEFQVPGLGKLVMTAGRLAGLWAYINDGRRNLEAETEEEANFRAGSPNVEMIPALVLGFLPVLVGVATKACAPGEHLMTSYGCGYWIMMKQFATSLNDIRRQKAAAAAAVAAAAAAVAAAAPAAATLMPPPTAQGAAAAAAAMTLTPPPAKPSPATVAAAAAAGKRRRPLHEDGEIIDLTADD